MCGSEPKAYKEQMAHADRDNCSKVDPPSVTSNADGVGFSSEHAKCVYVPSQLSAVHWHVTEAVVYPPSLITDLRELIQNDT